MVDKYQNSIIKVRGLTKRFGKFTAVDNLNFDVSQSEIFGFLGANGAGKTTAIKILCGLSSPSEGNAEVAGFDVYKQTENIKKNIGYMSQSFSLYEDMTIVENIRFYGGIYGMPLTLLKERTNHMLNRLKMTEYANKLIKEIPLGWKQKLAFSVATLHRPKIVFLDEPTGGVDPITRRQFWDLIYEAIDIGITVFVTTHYMDEAEYCHRVSIMVDGKIAALDTPDNLKQQYNAKSMNEVFLQLARKK